jgi:predicted nuclease of predicted toxin-antitoxin system
MTLVADESIERIITARLRSEGHNVTAIIESHPGMKDDDILALAHNLQAVLLTADKDFGELVFRLHRLSTGVILHRLLGMFTVVDPGAVRIRPLLPPTP